jgi:DNA-binding PadR family transcriptional regulator
MPALDEKLITREIRLGFWKLHILHHAAEQPVVGQWMLGELRHHGYDLSPGTLYPLLKRMERNGWLRSEVEPGGGPSARRYYHLTRTGRQVLDTMRPMIGELHDELMKKRSRRPAGRARR